jgi:hypothetical protein
MTRLAPFALATGLALVASAPANAGGILLCNEYGCRSIVEFPLPITVAIPPVVYMAPNPPRKVIREGYRDPRGPGGSFSANRPPIDQRGPPVRFQNQGAMGVAPPLADAPTGSPGRYRPEVNAQGAVSRGAKVSSDRQAQREIEADIQAFCGAPDHVAEPFCQKLGAYLAEHPEARPRQ